MRVEKGALENTLVYKLNNTGIAISTKIVFFFYQGFVCVLGIFVCFQNSKLLKRMDKYSPKRRVLCSYSFMKICTAFFLTQFSSYLLHVLFHKSLFLREYLAK